MFSDKTTSQTKSEKEKLDLKTLKRLLHYLRQYRMILVLVFVFVLIASVANAASFMFFKFVIDDFIVPCIESGMPDFAKLFNILAKTGLIFLCGILSNYMEEHCYEFTDEINCGYCYRLGKCNTGSFGRNHCGYI